MEGGRERKGEKRENEWTSVSNEKERGQYVVVVEVLNDHVNNVVTVTIKTAFAAGPLGDFTHFSIHQPLSRHVT